MGNVKHSITLYGFCQPYLRGEVTFEEVIQKAKNMGGDGIEIVAPQMVKGHPNPSEQWQEYFTGILKDNGLQPVCYSVYVDSGKNKGRFLTDAERFVETINEMEYAKKMGFSVVRSQDALLPATMEKLAPYAEEMGIHLAIELHGPWAPSSPLFLEYYDLFERKNSEFLGVVPDFSAFMSGAPGSVLHRIPDDICHKDILNEINVLYSTTEIPEEELDAMILARGGDELDIRVAHSQLYNSVQPGDKMGGRYYRTKPEYDGFRRLLKYSKYMHGKFMYVDENLEHVGIDYPGFVKIMKEENYQGFVASEYEGDIYDPTISDEEQVRRHIRMLEKLWLEV